MNDRNISSVVDDGINIGDLGVSCIEDLGSLFTAANKLADNPTLSRNLIRIGMYLSEHWAHMIEEERDNLEQARSKQGGGNA